MSKQSKHSQGHAYRRMMERVKHALDGHAHSQPSALDRALGWAREQAVNLGEIGHEEAQKIADYVYRDIKDLADHLNAARKDNAAWLHMDLELVEAEIWDLLTSVADKTRVELAELEAQADAYYTGEVAGPGSLYCDACGHVISLKEAEEIPSCPQCDGNRFHRLKESE